MKKFILFILFVIVLASILFGGFKGKGKIWYSDGSSKEVEFDSWNEFSNEFGGFFDSFKK